MADISTGKSFTLGTVLQEVVGKNIRIFPIFMKQFKHLAAGFLDIKQLAGEGGYTVAPKYLPGIEPTITVDGYSVKWLENSLYDFQTTVPYMGSYNTDTYGNVTINVADTSGFAVNDTIYVTKADTGTSDEFDAIVTEIQDANNLAIRLTSLNSTDQFANVTINTEAGQTVLRGYWTRNDNDEITRPSAVYKYQEFHTYVQHFSRRIEFTKAEINKEYKYEGDAKEMVSQRLIYNLGIMFQEINKALYKGKNRAPGAGANDKMEMLGLEEVVRQTGGVVDLAQSTDPIKDFFRALEQVQLSDVTGAGGTTRLLVNDKFLSEISSLERNKIRYDKKVDSIDFEIPTLATAFGEIEILRDPMMNLLYNYPVAFTLPAELIKLWIRPNQSVNEKGAFTATDKSVHIYPVIHNLREKELFDMEIELGLIAGGMSATKTPYKMIKNFVAPVSSI
jgi:hypothetical protein